MARTARLAVRPTSPLCPLCKHGPEDVSHFLQQCSVLTPIRNAAFGDLRSHLTALGLHGCFAWRRFSGGGRSQLNMMLGTTIAALPVGPRNRIAWILDDIMKRFFNAMWKYRSSLIAHSTARRDRPPPHPGPASKFWRSRPDREDAHRCWTSWLPQSARFDVTKFHKRRNFFVV
jgi:hypothetical protein